MREYAALNGHVIRRAHPVKKVQQQLDACDIVRCGIDPDDRVSVRQHQSVDNRGQYSSGIIRRVIWLKPRRETTRQSDRGPKARNHTDARCDGNQVLNAHQLGDSGGHLGSNPRRQRRENIAGRVLAQQPVAKISDSQMPDRRECAFVVTIEDKPGYFIGFRKG